MTINKTELLNNVFKFYRDAFGKDTKAKEYLNSLGFNSDDVFARFKLGYSNGSLLKAIPSKGSIRNDLKEMNLLIKSKEYFYDCLIFPIFDKDDNCIGLIGKRISDHKEIFLPNPLETVFNWKAIVENKILIFTETMVDSLTLYQLGYLETIPLIGEIPESLFNLLKTYNNKKIYLLLNSQEKIDYLSQRLDMLGVTTYKINLADGVTIYEYIHKHSHNKEDFEKLLNSADPLSTKIGQEGIVKVTDDVITFEFSNRKYQVKELDKEDKKRLRVNIRAVADGLIHIDTIDLYVSRSRITFTKAISNLYDISSGVVEQDLSNIIQKLEKLKYLRENVSIEEKTKSYEMSQDDEEESLNFLKQSNILDSVVKHLDIMGYVGEELNKKIGYLITISRKLDSPLSGVIISRSGAGKSKLMEYLANLVPPEDTVTYTRITPQALYYKEDKSLKHKLMIAGEEEGLNGSNYPLRELISSKKLRLAAPIKDHITGKMKTVEYEVEGPIALLFSTTKPSINYENATRCFVLSLDESQEQTERIHKEQRLHKTITGYQKSQEAEQIIILHRNSQRLLKKLIVINPYAENLTFPAHWLQSRREQEKYLSLIETIAFLNQYKKEIKKMISNGREVDYIEIDINDIEEANKLMKEILKEDLDELSKPSRELLELIKKMVEEKSKELLISKKELKFNRRDVREYTGWSAWQIRSHLKELETLQYIIPVSGERGRMYKYELAYDGKLAKLTINLIDADKLKK